MAFALDGEFIRVLLHPMEAELLGELAGQLAVLLGSRETTSDAAGDDSSVAALLAQLGIGGSTAAPLDPALARLLPDAYRGDEAASSEHRRLTELGLVERKIANASAVVESLAGAPIALDRPTAQSWLRTLTDLRLTLAARLHIATDADEASGDEATIDVYEWLGYLQGALLESIEQRELGDAH